MWRIWRLADEPFGVHPVCVGEHGGALVADGLGGAVVDAGGSVQAQPVVVMIVVIPSEEGLASLGGRLLAPPGRARSTARPTVLTASAKANQPTTWTLS